MTDMEKPDPLWLQIIGSIQNIGYAIFVASMVGTVSYLNKIRKDWRRFEWGMLILAFVTGGLNGYFAFLVCDSFQLTWQTTAILTGAAGGGGSEMFRYLIDMGNRRTRGLPK